jgi:NADPH-dependent 2,4-dienoyl-CoA reductase/sulfur reductase-like enzyme
LDDARRLSSVSGESAVTVGSGFIALEFLMSFAARGFKNIVVLRGNSFFSRMLDAASAKRVDDVLAAHGVELRRGATVRAIDGHGSARRVHLSTGESVPCHAVGVGIGLVPNVAFLDGSGIATREGVLVDDRLRASAPDVHAAGDVAEYLDPLVGLHHRVGNWTNATLQGKRAGLTMAGEDAPYDQLTSYSISCFGLPLAFVGANDVAPDEVLVREYSDGSVLQARLLGGRVIAATSVGAFAERVAVQRLMVERRLLEAKQKKAFIEPKISLSGLLS